MHESFGSFAILAPNLSEEKFPSLEDFRLKIISQLLTHTPDILKVIL